MIIIYLYKNNAKEAQETTTNSKCKKKKKPKLYTTPNSLRLRNNDMQSSWGRPEYCIERPTENTENGDLGSVLYLGRTK